MSNHSPNGNGRLVLMAILQLNPPIPLNTPKGHGQAHFLIDYSFEHDLHWVVMLDETGECWTFPNPEIRAEKNITAGRAKPLAPPVANH